MRVALLLVLALGCGKSSTKTDAPAASRFLPASPDLVVRLDLDKLRAWPHYGKVAPSALAGVTNILDAAKQRCNLDIMGEAKSIMLARRGALLEGDLTVIVRGLDRAKVTSCADAIAKGSTTVKLTVDGDLVHASLADKPIASGAFLAGGDIVLVSRGGAGVVPAAWKTEVTQGANQVPAYLAELSSDPIAVRAADDKRTIVASIALGDPLVAKGTITTKDEASAAEQGKLLTAINSYLSQGDAGTGRVEPKGAVVHADFTATGKQIDNLIAIAMPALFAPGPPRDVVADATAGPGDCTQLPPAVEKYIGESMAKAAPDRRAQMEAIVATLVPALQKAFVETCTADRWTSTVVDCHVTNATALNRFEQCRQLLNTEQRERLDKALTAALGN